MKRTKILFGWSKPYLALFLIVLFLSGFLQYLYSYLSILIQYAINVLDGSRSANLPTFILKHLNNISDPLNAIINVGIIIIIVQLFRSIMRFTDSYIRGRLAENMRRDMRFKLYEHINNLSYAYHNDIDTGDFIQRCTSDVDTSSRFVARHMPGLVSTITIVIAGAWQIANISMEIMLVSVISIPISVAASIIYFRSVNRTYIDIEKSEAKMTTIIQENLSGVKVVKAFANEIYENEKMDIQSKDYMKKSKNFSKMRARFFGVSEIIAISQFVITIAFGISLSRNNQMAPGDIAACVILLGMMVWPVRSLGRIISEFGKALVAADRINKVLIEKSEYDIDGKMTPDIKGSIEFKNVSFKFDSDSMHLLKNVSFKINSGEVVAFVGKTGSGKSTITNIMTRLLNHDSGDVLIDGIKIQDIKKKHLRKQIGIVMQEPFLFSKTVYDNIAIANKEATEDMIYGAAKIASVHNDIKAFNKGYFTLVGEKGTTLSGGQKQRVAIARILVDKRPVIIFDDSLSAVDTKTDLRIRSALKRKKDKITMIIITHRTTTAKEADKIIVLDKGTVESIGTHEELILQEGLYKKLWNIQGKLEEEFLEFIKGGAKIE